MSSRIGNIIAKDTNFYTKICLLLTRENAMHFRCPENLVDFHDYEQTTNV